MADEKAKKSWMRRRVEGAIRGGLTRTYDTVKVDPGRFLMQLRVAHGLPLATFQGVYTLPVERLDDVAESVIRGGMKMAAAEGAGFGLGGILTIVPDLGILSAITMRTIQKLSLIYGFELNTEDEIAELWIAAASAAGVDIGRELLEKEVVNRVCAARDPADCRQGRRRSGREVGGPPDSDCQFGYRMRAELLLRPGVGRAGASAFPRQASRSEGRFAAEQIQFPRAASPDIAVVKRANLRTPERDSYRRSSRTRVWKPFTRSKTTSLVIKPVASELSAVAAKRASGVRRR